MATVLYGGSPRHHNNRITTTNAHHLHHQHQQQQNALQQQQQSQQQLQQHHQKQHNSHYISPMNQSSSSSSNQQQQQHPSTPSSVLSYSNSHHQTNASSILMPPSSYLSTGTLLSSSSVSIQQQQHQQHQQQQQQQHTTTHHHTTTIHQQQIQSHIQYQQQQQSHYHHATLMYPGIGIGSGGGRHHHKRRSAVEMLAESKQFYVKSETVLDRHQHLAYRSAGSREGIVIVGNSSGGIGSVGGITGINKRNLNNSSAAVAANAACILSPVRTLSHHHHHHHHHHSGSGSGNNNIRSIVENIASQRPPNRRSASSSSDLLQTKLRKLLNADTKECPVPEIPRYKGGTNGAGKKYDTFSKFQSVKYHQELSIHSSNDQCGDSNVLFPSAFLSPQSLPPNPVSDDDIYSYGIEEPLILTDDYRAISPPAEYAAVDDSSPEKDQRCNYQRSFSHSHEVASDDPDYSSPSYNINSHKSLPDLHSQISRHSPHSEVLSCCSRGNRSNKSGGGSSLNRDSGGSSGHYTHRSEPCCKQRELTNKMYLSGGNDYRRDSGSSTQHSGNSYYTYGISSTSRFDCPECRSKYQKDSECLLNFTTPEVPEAFQDEYPSAEQQLITKSTRFYEENKNTNRKLYSQHNKLQGQQHQHSPTTNSSGGVGNNGSSGCIKEPELSPPLGTFKRQKCFRFKQRNRYSTSNDRSSCRTENINGTTTLISAGSGCNDDDRKPILRSKSDISDRYWNRNGVPIIEQIQSNNNKLTNALDKRGKSESLSQLEKFFDRLGLNDEKFEEIYNVQRRFSSDNDSDQSSTVFFSDVSTVDSTRLPDSTETQSQSQQTQPYRPTEPPSIVERNARIIKWLCNCRKLALT